MPRKLPYAPSWLEVILGAVLSFVLGVALAASYLILRPVVTVKQLPKEEERDLSAVYYIEGSRDSGKGREASSKRAQFLQGKSVTVTEDELNTLITPAAPPPKPAPPPKKKEGEVVPDMNAQAQIAPPIFRIRDSVVQIAIPVKFGAFGAEAQVLVLAKGTFVRDGNQFVYEPAHLTIGTCSLDRLPIVFGFVYRHFIASQPIPPDISAAWAKVTGVHVEGEMLKITMP